ncbi:MAG: hypothetical protein IT436_00905 [Phycisphaerales bacterium]|nr:hypothetical protein [Phycisphaerales bacterium]
MPVRPVHRSVMHLLALAGPACAAGPALAQNGEASVPTPELRSHDVAYPLDSGLVSNPGAAPAVVWSANVVVPDASWLRLFFETVDLAGDPTDGTGAYLLITSLIDGGTQRLDGVSALQWQRSTAYFNGEALTIQLVAPARAGASRVVLRTAVAGEPPLLPRSICGTSDNRVLSSDPRNARLMPVGCTAWLINDVNHQFLTAGHCGPSAGQVVQFNVPLSSAGGGTINPPPEDQYYVEGSSASATSGGIGFDAAYFGVYPNSNTGLTPYQRQGSVYTLAAAAPGGSGQTIRVTGYGTVSSPVSPTWNQVQKTHTGPYAGLSGTNIRYTVDTTGGNSGSPVILDSTGEAIGVHTHAGCTSGSGTYNNGTAIQWGTLQGYLAAPKGICKSGIGAVAGPLFVSTDLNNNFGTANTATGQFAKVSLAPAQIHGLAFNRNIDRFYAVDNTRKLHVVNPDTGAFTLVGTISGTTLVITGLGYDPGADILYGLAQSNGQLFSINTASAAATAIGAPAGNTVGGIDYDATNNILYGLADLTGGTRLFRISTATGAQTLVGTLGTGINDCNGLAWNDRDGLLYTINAANGQLLRINPATGVATLVGATNALFSGTAGGTGVGAYGMAVRQIAVATCEVDLNGDGIVDFADYLEFLTRYDAADLSVDFNGDGMVDFADYLEFLTLYDAGC